MADRIRARATINPAQLNRLLTSRTGAVGKVMAGFAGLATRETRQVADERVNRQSGRYYDSIRSTTEGSPRGVKVVTSSINYGGAPEKATRPHVIRPRRARVLRFQVAGRTVYATRVFHPGTKARSILRDGARRAGRRLGSIAR